MQPGHEHKTPIARSRMVSMGSLQTSRFENLNSEAARAEMTLGES